MGWGRRRARSVPAQPKSFWLHRRGPPYKQDSSCSSNQNLFFLFFFLLLLLFRIRRNLIERAQIFFFYSRLGLVFFLFSFCCFPVPFVDPDLAPRDPRAAGAQRIKKTTERLTKRREGARGRCRARRGRRCPRTIFAGRR